MGCGVHGCVCVWVCVRACLDGRGEEAVLGLGERGPRVLLHVRARRAHKRLERRLPTHTHTRTHTRKDSPTRTHPLPPRQDPLSLCTHFSLSLRSHTRRLSFPRALSTSRAALARQGVREVPLTHPLTHPASPISPRSRHSITAPERNGRARTARRSPGRHTPQRSPGRHTHTALAWVVLRTMRSSTPPTMTALPPRACVACSPTAPR